MITNEPKITPQLVAEHGLKRGERIAATNRWRYASSAARLRFRLIALRSPSASPTVNPARATATSST